MGPEGGPADTLLRCARDGVETRLQCAGCGTAICPACYVRTPVGLRCPTCGADSGAPVPVAAATKTRAPVVVGVAVVVAMVVAGAAWVATRGGGSGPADVGAEGTARTVVPMTLLGRGQFPGGVTWILEARRDGAGVCTTFTLSPGPPAQERCRPDRGVGAIRSTTTSMIRSPDGSVYITLGQVSDGTERVRIAAEGAVPSETPTLGGGTGLDARFFVTHTTNNLALTITALAADGLELGRVDQPPMPDPPR